MAKSIKELIAENKLDLAAVMMTDGLRSIFSRAGMGMDLTREEFLKVSPKLLEILETGKLPEIDPTEDPGDDIDINPAVATLTVTFEGPNGDDDFEALPTFTKNVAVGSTFTFAPYTVVGYTADKTLIEGKMTKNGVTEKVTYSKNEPAPEEKFTLTITYVGPSGDPDFVAPAAYTAELGKGEEYMVISPTVEGYTPDKDKVDGAITEDTDVTVTYTKATPVAKHTLSIEYVGPEGDTEFTAPEDYLAKLDEGEEFMVTSPVVEGYTPDKASVSGAMATADIEETVTYSKNA